MDARNLHMQVLDELLIHQETSQHALTIMHIAQLDVEMGTPKKDVQKNIDTARTILNGHALFIAFCDAIEAALHMRERNLSAAWPLLQKSFKWALGRDSDTASYCLEKLGNVGKWSTSDAISST
jgi:hypothetical protein